MGKENAMMTIKKLPASGYVIKPDFCRNHLFVTRC